MRGWSSSTGLWVCCYELFRSYKLCESLVCIAGSKSEADFTKLHLNTYTSAKLYFTIDSRPWKIKVLVFVTPLQNISY